MKVCLLLQRRFAYIGNEIAALLKDRHGISEFCAYVFTRDSYDFLSTQKDVAYTTLLFDEDVHNLYRTEALDWEFLRNLEREYGIPTLWQYIENDRIVRYSQLVREYPYNTPSYTHEEMLRIVQVTAKKILAFVDAEKPDIVVFTAVGAIGSILLYTIAKRKGIRTLNIRGTRIESGHLISEHYSLFTELDRVTPTKENMDAARAFVREFREKPAPYTNIDSISEKPPTRSRHFSFLSPQKITATLAWQWKLWTRYLRSASRNDYSTIKPWHMVLDRIRRKSRILIGYEDLYEKPSREEKYAYFPLHMEPEVATMLFTPVFNDQLWVIKQVARTLPVGYKLYVKEHVAMFGYRTRAFYRELKKIPNVKLMSPSLSSFLLIREAQLVVTLTSTVGWEAVLLQKPVITFGDVFYNALSGVRRCHDIEGLPHLIRVQLDSFVHNEEELIQFIGRIYHESVPLDLADMWQREQGARVKERREELIPIVDLLFSKASAPKRQ